MDTCNLWYAFLSEVRTGSCYPKKLFRNYLCKTKPRGTKGRMNCSHYYRTDSIHSIVSSEGISYSLNAKFKWQLQKQIISYNTQIILSLSPGARCYRNSRHASMLHWLHVITSHWVNWSVEQFATRKSFHVMESGCAWNCRLPLHQYQYFLLKRL